MATHIIGRLRRSVGLLAGLSLLISMFVFTPGATNAQSTDPTPDYLASFDACPEDVIPDADFADVPGRHDNASDINCIAYYGITKGTSATTYSPEAPVIREHMALFLIRLAKLVDIYVPPPGSTPFTDTAGLSQESRDAISQIYQLGITIGTSATTYTPARNVTRGEMALFLQRLMDQMDVVADGRDLYGYIPDDVDDNELDADVEAPWRDIRDVPRELEEAVTQLYELGVATGFGGSDRLYGPNRDMSRADMAAFMAAILDHSNLRPKGVNIQVTPIRGADDFDITVMISVRSDTFVPEEDQAVDWFYTDDPEGGLERNGECDISEILDNGDCEWDQNDDETDRDGYIFDDVRATAGETMTFYAWIGRRNGDEFDEDSVDFSKAQAVSEKGAGQLQVTHDVPVNAWQIGGSGGEWIVDMDRRSSVEFTIQLQDDLGIDLERQGVAIEIEVNSREILVDADNVNTDRQPDPDYRSIGRDSRDTTTVVTDRHGEATFELEGPSRDERLDEVIIETGRVTAPRIRIAWSQADPVLVQAKPEFEPYRSIGSDDTVSFVVEYNLYDQYGDDVRGATNRYTGRQQDVEATLKYDLYEVTETGSGAYGPTKTTTDGEASNVTFIRGRLRANLQTKELDPPATTKYFLVIKPSICSPEGACSATQSDRIDYVQTDNTENVVWVVTNAGRADDFDDVQNRSFTNPADINLKEVELYPADRKFRTFYTLWEYDSNDRFQSAGEEISREEFERLWEAEVNGVEDIDILLYGSGLSFFLIK